YKQTKYKIYKSPLLQTVWKIVVQSYESEFPEQPANKVAVIASVRNAHRFFCPGIVNKSL
uniref:hypothetical protein n=1 Tax=Ruminococcus bromii TaxID=40518 RepID=UPI003FD8345D